MTEKQAVLKSYVLWAWLERTGHSYKRDYPVKELLSDNEYYTCSLCEYTGQSRTNPVPHACSDCPMFGLWPDSYGNEIVNACYNGDYDLWIDASLSLDENKAQSEASHYAGNIAGALWKRYKELEDK